MPTRILSNSLIPLSKVWERKQQFSAPFYFDNMSLCMESELSQIEFYFPERGKEAKNKQELADLIIDQMKEGNSIEYCGYSDEQTLYKSIRSHLGDGNISDYRTISKGQKRKIEEIIKETIEKCNEALSVPTTNYVFVFPWFPTKDFEMFGGVMGVAPYSCVIHLFISLDSWTPKALTDSVAHELNHTIYYYHHYDKFNNYTLLDELIMEGLAENFREEVLDSKPSPWSLSLEEKEAFETLDSISEFLDSTDDKIIKQILFGDEGYKRWTGYSIGYWMVRRFREANPQFSWEELMKEDSHQILAFLHKKEV